jgi:hypothetical protein
MKRASFAAFASRMLVLAALSSAGLVAVLQVHDLAHEA